jgi:hypothetical protein
MIISEIKLMPFVMHYITTKRYNVRINENLINAYETMQKYHKENTGEPYKGSKNIKLISQYQYPKLYDEVSN